MAIRRGTMLVLMSMFTLVLLLLPSMLRRRQEFFEYIPEPNPPSPAYQRTYHHPDMKKLREEGRSRDISRVNIKDLDDEQVLLTLHSLLDNIDVICQRKLRMGNLEDKGWEVCDDDNVAPTPPGIVYAFGIDTDFQFEKDIANVYGVHVYSFDPAKQTNDYDVTNMVHFHNIGIDGDATVSKKGFAKIKFKDLRALLGHDKTRIDIIMMNSEHAEWASLHEMLESGSFPQLKQLFIEYHLDDKYPEQRRKWLETVQSIEKLGYRKFYVHKNFHCQMNVTGFPTARTRCYDVHYLRKP